MRILLKESVEHLGESGQLVEVKPGYARNFLVPKGKAIVVTRSNKKSIDKEIQKYQILEDKRLDGLRELAAKVAEANCTVAVKADENDKLYGSVSAEEICKALKLSGIDLSPKSIKIGKSIRSIGVFEVKVHLETNIDAVLKVWVVKE
jgi:large subunit ribosomal protein L9